MEANLTLVRQIEQKLDSSGKVIRRQDEELEQLRANTSRISIDRDELANQVARF
jgi:hypothetical protein